MSRVLLIALFASILLTGCDSASPDQSDDPELNERLEKLITFEGQRRLDNFVLPESDDFARIPQDTRNPLTLEKVALGKLLFHDPALSQQALHPSGQGTYSCATCHHAGAGFQAGRQQSMGDGGSGWGQNGEGRRLSAAYSNAEVDAPPLRSPTILNSAFQKVMLWSGAAGSAGPNRDTEAFWVDFGGAGANHFGYDGLESQAIVALPTHRLNRVSDTIVATNSQYQALWNQVFPGEPVTDERVGLAIAAYERTVLANRSPYQRWLKGETSAMTSTEKRGALVFFGSTGCSECHTGPALNSMSFYSLGMPDMQGAGVIRPPHDSRGRGDFIGSASTDFTYKIPQLYNLADSPFLGHGGTFKSVAEILDYYVAGVPDRQLPAGTVNSRFRPLSLDESEIADLTIFITNALRDPDLARYTPSSVPSGGCIPANDPQSRIDLGCN